MTMKPRSVMDKRTKRQFVADCLRAATGFGLTKRKARNLVAFFGERFIGLRQRSDRGLLIKCPQPGQPLSANKHPQNVMILGVIGSDEQKSPTIFVDADGKIDRLVYEGFLDRPVIPWVKVSYPEAYFAFQQNLRLTTTSLSCKPSWQRSSAGSSITRPQPARLRHVERPAGWCPGYPSPQH